MSFLTRCMSDGYNMSTVTICLTVTGGILLLSVVEESSRIRGGSDVLDIMRAARDLR